VEQYLGLIGKPGQNRKRSGHVSDADRAKEAVFGLLWNAHQPALPPFIVQWRFAKAVGRDWRADYGWPQFQLGLEVDGGVWRKGGGAHSHPSAILRDMEKHNDAIRCGVRLLRVTTDEVRTGKALHIVCEVMRALRLI